MSLFTTLKKTYVSSVVYNMAGPIEDRPNFLKSVVLGNMITQSKFSITDTIQKSYLSGPGLRLRGYHRWALKNYTEVGVPMDTFMGKPDFNLDIVAQALKDDFGINGSVDWVDSGLADITMWGRQWIRDNLPDKDAAAWRVDFIEATNEGLITFEDGTPPVRFTPQGYRRAGNWIYISYSRSFVQNRWTDSKMLIYEAGTGSALLDTQFLSFQNGGRYLPFIPIRHENKFISETYKPKVYEQAKKAYKKAIGAKFDDLVDQIKDNESLDEIDFAYVAFAVSLNTKDMASRRYIFNYFQELMEDQLVERYQYDTWAGEQPSVRETQRDWDGWRIVQQEVDPGYPPTEPAPSRPPTTSPPSSSVVIADIGPGKTNFKMEITWNGLSREIGTGQARAGAKKGDVWFSFGGSDEIDVSSYSADEAEDIKIDTVMMFYQTADDAWRKLTFKGLVHRNHIYNGKIDEQTAAQALLEADESGFLVPIRYSTFREMSLVDATQMSTQCCQVVFNCYQIVKKKWYQRGAFKVLIFVIIIITIAATGGFSAGGAGLLGSNAAVGTALGFSGLAATIAGVVANMVAAMVITKLIGYASIEIFGDKVGMIVAAIVSFVVIGLGTGMSNGGSIASSWSSLMEPMNLMNLTNSVGNAYSQILNKDTMAYMVKTQEALEDFRQQSLDLQQNYAENFGYGTAVFDPMRLTEVDNSFFVEPAETFLTRTLMTGSDIVEMSHDLISNFTELTLTTDLKV